MKLLFIGYLHGFGGAEKQLIKLANEMCLKGNEVYFITLVSDNQCYSINKDIKKIFIKDSSKFKIINRFLNLRKEIIKIKPDITINFWFQSVYFCFLISKKYTGKIIYSERGDPGNSEYDGIMNIIRKISFKKVDGFIFQSKGAMDYFDDNIKSRSRIIHNPISIDRSNLKFTKNRQKRIVNVGRLHPQKNQKLLIEAFSVIANEFPDYALDIYGDGPLYDELNQTIINNRLCDRVFLKGTSKNIYQEICNASLFVLSSDYEGLPNALIEALTLGIPAISTDCSPGGAREIIDSSDLGIIVPQNDKFALADAMKHMLLNNDDYADFLSNNYRKIIKKFDSNHIYAEWVDFFKDIIKK